MLPIKSPLDTYRAGFWVAKRNIWAIVVFVVLSVLNAMFVNVLASAGQEFTDLGPKFLVVLATFVP